jgi:ABC-type multidrug transport system fused ATPase/permease subunit
MSTGVIVAIVVVVVLLLLLLAVLPRLRERARIRARERELGQRREHVIEEHRQDAEVRVSRAEEAEQRARIAEQEAQQQRAAAQLSQEKAGLHEAGLADHELIEDHERERFAGTSAVESPVPDAERPAGDR